MKKLVKAVGLSFVVVSSAFFANAAEAAQKVGYINTGYIIQNLPQREIIIKKNQTALKDARAELDKLRAKIDSMRTDIKKNGEINGPDWVKKQLVEIRKLEAEGEFNAEEYNKKAQSMEFQSRQQMIALIQEATKKIAEKEGYEMVVDAQALLYSDDASNLTKKVLAELK